jgi:hypothetical protein
MDTHLDFDILKQPNDTTCGPTCLHAVYRYFGESVPLEEVIHSVPQFPTGGTLAVFLGCHALRRGYKARLYTYNLAVFDPTWFSTPGTDLAAKLREQARHKQQHKLQEATRGYLEFLALGGEICSEDLRPGLIRHYLRRNLPILTGLSSTWLYQAMREYGPNDDEDDVRGEPVGHFVVLCGYDAEKKQVAVADPMHPVNPYGAAVYPVAIERVITAILLGILTYDGNLLVIEPDHRNHRGKQTA